VWDCAARRWLDQRAGGLLVVTYSRSGGDPSATDTAWSLNGHWGCDVMRRSPSFCGGSGRVISLASRYLATMATQIQASSPPSTHRSLCPDYLVGVPDFRQLSLVADAHSGSATFDQCSCDKRNDPASEIDWTRYVRRAEGTPIHWRVQSLRQILCESSRCSVDWALPDEIDCQVTEVDVEAGVITAEHSESDAAHMYSRSGRSVGQQLPPP